MLLKKLIFSSIVLASPISDAAGINKSGVIFDETGRGSTNGENGHNLDSFNSLLSGTNGLPFGTALFGGGFKGNGKSGRGRGLHPNQEAKSGLLNDNLGVGNNLLTLGSDKNSVQAEEQFDEISVQDEFEPQLPPLSEEEHFFQNDFFHRTS
ncbi:hypothetical protein CONCODRAFT_13635 [Conidiobolus coronatus NRRL 28638]|uniref:Uncharacterized protein n=1 Tax=Conidiobolus coronatus (strain ATCC 28846 / CBS 209.66 / NRRL 28638) TaxID=796925 RepID=A0A137NQC9_CONC2|nr:hypothetical protein CONCODRAFT_13635 [Conidiobolus coronatus NRRL 28638]|eukprot:KXN64959.1 hypothetical protein CONCODRAFT_13635 [Conidiobolus coronatus NRRL 28638]